ncbi:hypothetical protein [Roseovarius autotrophicus]|uniref:hypothetical protein n=1 Tax=Roseovarius autotrophicus TaxID=2824121 RepID=UPI0019DC719C|nr:hypothetical protein [Roseovarius autotrophicus]MBE0454229.1 hypothetical protein [Roseovarius sp.]
MKRAAPVLLLAGLVACAPPPLYHKAGADPAQLEALRTRCEVAALRDVPRDIRTTYVPPRYVPRAYYGLHGRHHGGVVLIEPGRTESYDANADLRARVVDQCVAEAGFRPVRLPACADGTPAPEVGSPIPPLERTSCARRMPGGGWQIVTPG